MRTERFSTPGPITLDLRLPAGSVEIETTEAGETVVELDPVRDDDAARAAVEYARVELAGDELLVEVQAERLGRRFFFVRGVDVRVRVRCPHETRLRLNVTAADVRALGRFGTSDIRSVSGDVLLGEVTGDLDLRSVSGDASVGRVSGDARIESVSGDLKLDAAARSVRTKTVSGDINLASVREGEVVVQTVSGDARVAVEPGSRVYVDTRSLSGDIASELDVTDTPPSGDGPSLEIRGKTVSGDVRVVRA